MIRYWFGSLQSSVSATTGGEMSRGHFFSSNKLPDCCLKTRKVRDGTGLRELEIQIKQHSFKLIFFILCFSDLECFLCSYSLSLCVFKVGLISSPLHALIFWTLWSPVREDLSTPVSLLSLPSEISTWIINAAFRTCLPAQGNASLSTSAFLVASDSSRSWVSPLSYSYTVHRKAWSTTYLQFLLYVLLSATEVKSLSTELWDQNFFFWILFIKKHPLFMSYWCR